MNSNISEYELTENRLITVLPNSYIHVTYQSPDCRLYLLAFDQRLMNRTYIFSALMRHLHFIIDSPLLELDSEMSAIIRDYVVLLIRLNRTRGIDQNNEIVTSILHFLLSGLGSYYRIDDIKLSNTNRSTEIVKRLVQHIVKHYARHRSPAYYAELLDISPQHLSTVVARVTGHRVIDIIAQMLIVDAQTKLRCTEMTIHEIATSLNFADISLFGKYFKRYTGVSPRQYREQEM